MDSDIDIFLNALRKAIINDSNQFNRAKTDTMYGNFRKEVNVLLEVLIQEKRTIAEKEYSDLEYSMQKMKKWFLYNYSNFNEKQKYENVLTELLNVRNQIETKEYALYVKAINNMANIRRTIDQIQISIKNDLDLTEKELDSNNNYDIKSQQKNIYKNKNRLILKAKADLFTKIIICWGLVLMLASSVLFYAYVESLSQSSGLPHYGVMSPLLLTLYGVMSPVLLTLGFSAILALYKYDQNYISTLFVYFIPSYIFLVIIAILATIINIFAKGADDIIMLIVTVIILLGLIFGPYLVKSKNFISDISKIETEILNLKNEENKKNKRNIYLQEKIQTAKESF